MSAQDKMDVDPADPDPPPVFDREALERELDEKYACPLSLDPELRWSRYPNRPRNHSKTLPFHTLFEDLFNPLNENKKRPVGLGNRRRQGPNGGLSTNPQERRREIIERFISRWRREVGDDIYPAFRLIIPEKDRERAMYGLKEKALGKFLVKIMKIDKNSEDGFSLLNWKLPGQSTGARMAGDFAGRCYEVISKRPFRIDVGDMTIEEVNDLLDQLSAAPREEHQLPILTEFYRRMNAEELMWLIRVILRQMKVGATEKTFFHLWHPDAETLFNVSSSLRRVCWELWNPETRLESEERGVTLMQCFQPQLAQFQMRDFKQMVEKMRPTEDDPEFWIEEKLDGERMQMHMISDDSIPGGKRFNFWSRKAKDYTYLYGNGFYDKNGALTQFIKDAFRDGVENVILDGEMITWDPEQDAPVPFGTLKTAAISEQRNPFAGGQRPLLRVFDILLLNDRPLTRYTLRDRRKALEASISPVHRRLELLDYSVGTKPADIEARLREVVAQASEGLVIKNPRSAYHLNERNDDWIKVKPEYMTEFGESLDCLIIGGLYGSGRRGGSLSSFLCGLRLDDPQAPEGEKSQKFLSFFKVGGGLTANDYATIRHLTDGKWTDWDPKRPPNQYIDLGGGASLQRERPDVWIRPCDSVVVEVKAAEVTTSDDYGCNMTLRFPRFKRLRLDKNWETALSFQEFLDLRATIEQDRKEKAFKVDNERQMKRRGQQRKKVITVAGYHAKDVNGITVGGPLGNVFAGLTFYIMTESTHPEKRSKVELEELVKANGGKIVQTHNAVENTVCVAERRTVKVASLEKRGDKEIVKPLWLFDCIQQARADFAKGLPELVVPLEMDRHMYFVPADKKDRYMDTVDEFGDSYARDTTVEELRTLMTKMGHLDATASTVRKAHDLIDAESQNDVPGWMFSGTTIYFYPSSDGDDVPHHDHYQNNTANQFMLLQRVRTTAEFAGATIATDLTDKAITHVVVVSGPALAPLRQTIAQRSNKVPRLVTPAWIQESWTEGTRLDEERFAPGLA